MSRYTTKTAYALGVAESDITWDADAQKVCLKLGENVVEMIIGSSVITINEVLLNI